MNNISFPIQLVTLIRRLVNVISTISLTNQYLLSRIQADNYVSEDQPQLGGSPTRHIDRIHRPVHSRWNWLTPGYTYDWTSTIRLVCSSDPRSKDPLRPGMCSDHAALPSWSNPCYIQDEQVIPPSMPARGRAHQPLDSVHRPHMSERVTLLQLLGMTFLSKVSFTA